MTQEFLQVLQLTAMGATGQPASIAGTEIDWKTLLAIAGKQKVAGYIAHALKMAPGLRCPPEIRDPLIRHARALALSNAVQRGAVLQLLGEMETAGIHAVLLKGYAIADCYAVPESRRSADTDIWVAPEDEDAACSFMKAHGFTVDPRWKSGHHAVCHHPRLGCVEVHVLLYDEIVEDIWFGRMDGSEFVTEPHRFIASEDGHYYTLGHTDHIIFLALHMIKHFIISGLTVQMMMDVGLYFRAHMAEIDVGRFWDTIRSLQYDKLMSCILWTLIQYGGFGEKDFPGIAALDTNLINSFLTDLERGGWMGHNDKEAREKGWQEYNRQKMLKSRGNLSYLIHMGFWKLGMLGTVLFPPVHKLRQKFPYLNRWPVLLPVAWLHRLVFRGGKAVRNGELTNGMVLDPEKIGSAAKERIGLFRELEML